MLRTIVVGCGENATALALSLIASGRPTTMVVRDDVHLKSLQSSRIFPAFQPMESLSAADWMTTAPGRFASSSSSSSRHTRPLLEVRGMGEHALLHDTEVGQVILAIPLASYFDDRSVESLSRLLQRVPRASHGTDNNQQEQGGGEGSPDSVSNKTHFSHATGPPVIVSCRGLHDDGRTPVDVLCSSGIGGDSPVVHLCGNYIAKEWAMHSWNTAREQHLRTLSGKAASDEISSHVVVPSVASLTFAANEHTTFEQQQRLHALFQRETVDWAPELYDLLPIFQACCIVASIAAGMASNVYPGSVTAGASVYQHALLATTQLLTAVRSAKRKEAEQEVAACTSGDGKADVCSSSEAKLDEFLNRNRRPPRDATSAPSPLQVPFTLPPNLTSTLLTACTNFSAREFVFGRKLSFHFRRSDALRGVFRPQCPHRATMESTVEGLSALSATLGVKIPFFESTMDAVLTLRRSDEVGKWLVWSNKHAWFHEPEKHMAVTPLMEKIRKVDEAVVTGNDAAFEAARSEVETYFAEQGALMKEPLL